MSGIQFRVQNARTIYLVKKDQLTFRNNEPYIVYTLYYDQLLSILMDLVQFSSEFGRKIVR